MEAYLWPDLIILGGGVSKELPRYKDWLVTRAPVKAAVHLNSSGIIGAAVAARYAARVDAAKADAERSDARRAPTRRRAPARSDEVAASD